MESMNTQVENFVNESIAARQKVILGYRQYIIAHGHQPGGVTDFCKEISVSEESFLEIFKTLDEVADAVWADMLDEVLNAVESKLGYNECTTREKVHHFYQEFFMKMKTYRSYLLLTFGDGLASLGGTPAGMGELKKKFKTWVKELIAQGVQLEQLANRRKITVGNVSLFWFQFLFFLNIWKHDKSPAFETTNIAVEKAVTLTFDLIEKNALDSAFDFGKFILQTED